MRKEAVHTWGQGHYQLHGIGLNGIQQGSINASFTSARKPGSSSSAPMKATVMAWGPRGTCRYVIYGCRLGFTGKIHGLFFLFMRPLELRATPSVRLSVWDNLLPAYDLPMTILELNLALSPIQFGPAIMVRPEHQMLSSRGTSRWGSSCPPIDEDSPHFFHCHYHRTQGANPLRSNQFLDTGDLESSSSLTFGSAIFNFTSSLNRPRINAHVLVLFIEENSDESDSRDNQGTMPDDGSARDMETPSAGPVNVLENFLAGPSGV